MAERAWSLEGWTENCNRALLNGEDREKGGRANFILGTPPSVNVKKPEEEKVEEKTKK